MKEISFLLIMLIACLMNTAAQAAATLTFTNNCAVPLQIMSPTNSSINGFTLNQNIPKTLLKSSLDQNAVNTFLVAPVTTNAQCTSIACQNWTAIQETGQRIGAMWQSPNLVYAAYCQATNAAVKQCNQTAATPCCSTAMNYDKTFGTTFELTPNGGTNLNQDYVDLSTNYGSGPTSPPLLCGGNNPADNCVTANANIFFNVPVQVTMSQSCAFPPGVSNPGITTLSCNEVSCPDAFQHPTDNKLAVCPSDTNYTVTYCPGSNQLPTIPLAS